MMQKNALNLILLLTVGFLLAQSFSIYAGDEKIITKTFKVNSGGKLLLNADFGSVRVNTIEQKAVKITVKMEFRQWDEEDVKEFMDRLELDFSQTGDDISVIAKLPKKWMRSGENVKIEFDMEVPRQYHLDLNTSGGSIWIDDLEGEVNARTSGGSLRLGNIVGPVDVKTSGGSIQLEGCKGDAYVKTSGGSITIGNVEGEVNAHTSGGSVNIGQVSGMVDTKTSGGSITVEKAKGSVNARTSGGSIRAYISEQPREDCTLTTSGGTIKVYLDSQVAVYVDAKTSSGHVKTDFEVLMQGRQDDNSLRGKISSGGPELYLRTSGGNVYIEKK